MRLKQKSCLTDLATFLPIYLVKELSLNPALVGFSDRMVNYCRSLRFDRSLLFLAATVLCGNILKVLVEQTTLR